MGALIDLTGKEFGRLTVLSRVHSTGCGQPKWLCECKCGKVVAVFGSSLKGGGTVSCGCANLERVRKQVGKTLVLDGVSMTAAQWAQKLGINRSTIYSRLSKGMTVREALSSERYY